MLVRSMYILYICTHKNFHHHNFHHEIVSYCTRLKCMYLYIYAGVQMNKMFVIVTSITKFTINIIVKQKFGAIRY